MSLEELKNDWEAIGKSADQNKLSNEQIKAILKSKYRSFTARILIFEFLILLIYVYFIGLTIFKFNALGVVYLELIAIICIAMLAVLFIIRFVKLVNTFRNRFLTYSYASAIKNLARQKIRIQRFYLINIVLGFLLIVLLIILNIKFYNEYDLIQSSYFWITIIPCSLLFIVLVNKWMRKYYVKVIREAEDLLQELDE